MTFETYSNKRAMKLAFRKLSKVLRLSRIGYKREFPRLFRPYGTPDLLFGSWLVINFKLRLKLGGVAIWLAKKIMSNSSKMTREINLDFNLLDFIQMLKMCVGLVKRNRVVICVGAGHGYAKRPQSWRESRVEYLSSMEKISVGYSKIRNLPKNSFKWLQNARRYFVVG